MVSCRVFVFFLFVLSVAVSSCWAGVRACREPSKVLRSVFGPRLVSTGLPFHYNFRLEPTYTIQDKFEGGELKVLFENDMGDTLELFAFYEQEVTEGNLIHRIMFLPTTEDSPGIYRFRGEILVLNNQFQEACLLTLPDREIELVSKM